MDPKRFLGSEGVLAAAWLVFVSVYALLVFQFVSPAPWSEPQYLAWQLTSYLAELLALVVLVVAIGHLWYGTPTLLSRLLAGLSIGYVPLHLVMSRGIARGTELYLQLTHFRQAFYPVLTILALVLLLRAVAYRRSPGQPSADG